jgi:aspartate/methionine/tyrosine aminotransferase
MINIFKLEKYLSQYEFKAKYLLCCSDAESFEMQEIIAIADEQDRLLWNNLRLGYTDDAGLPILRQEIANSFYPGLDADNILCFAGAEDGIFCSLNVLCEPSDHIIILTPCYQSLLEIPQFRSSDITKIALKEENQWKIDIDAISKAIKSNTKIIIINFPHNPTGQIVTNQELKDLVALCQKHDIWLFSDEAYRLLGNPKQDWAKPAAICHQKAISLGVMSKAFGMAGLRIGWIACQNKEILQKIKELKHYTSICNSGPSEIISLIALKNKDKILARNNEIVRSNLALFNDFLSNHRDHFSWVEPSGGCVGFVNYKADEPVADFCKNLVEKQSVLLMPANIYDFDSNHFRIGMGRKNMPIALEKLNDFLKEK